MATPATAETQNDFIVISGTPQLTSPGPITPLAVANLTASQVATPAPSSPATPSVLLLEAGRANEGLEHMSGAERYEVAFQPGSAVIWGYKTSPQQPGGRVLDYSRGKGLVGSTAINFCG